MNRKHYLILYISAFPYSFTTNWTRQNAVHLAGAMPVVYIHDDPDAKYSVSSIFTRVTKPVIKNSRVTMHPFFPIRLPGMPNIRKRYFYHQLKLYTERILTLYDRREILLWFAVPSENFNRYTELFPRAKIVYDCTDYFAGLGKDDSALNLNYNEHRVVHNADIIFGNSPVIYNHLTRLYPEKKNNMHILPAGYEIGNFFSPPIDSRGSSRNSAIPVIGYIGGINGRIDFSLILSVIRKCPDAIFVFVEDKVDYATPYAGDLTVGAFFTALMLFTNVQLLKNVPHSRLPAIVSTFTAGIIPYRIDNLFNRYSNPIKLYAYLARGIPVISTSLPIMRYFRPHVRTATTATQFTAHIKNAIVTTDSVAARNKRRRIAWNHRIENKISVALKMLQL